MDRLAEMEAFTRVVELGGFTEAAKKLGVSKSAVSKHVAALETRLGARLLNRTTRRVSPTEIGLVYFEKAQTVLSAALEADAAATAMQDAPTGELKISAPLSFGVRHVAPALASFLMKFPNVSAKLHFEDRMVELVAEGYDIAIRIGDLPDSSLKAKKLAETELNLVASPDYLARRGEPTTIEELAEHEILHYSNSASGSFLRLRGPSGEERSVRVGGRLSINNGDALVTAALDGLGLTISPNFIAAEHLKSGALVEVMTRYAPPPIGVFAVYPPGRFTQPKQRAFIDHFADTLKGKGPRW